MSASGLITPWLVPGPCRPASLLMLMLSRIRFPALSRGFRATPPACGLLKGIDPILTADLLHVLRSAGHGDNIVIVDCNFPAAQVATRTTTGKHIELAGVTATQAVPLDWDPGS
jgi:hypothetical protein